MNKIYRGEGKLKCLKYWEYMWRDRFISNCERLLNADKWVFILILPKSRPVYSFFFCMGLRHWQSCRFNERRFINSVHSLYLTNNFIPASQFPFVYLLLCPCPSLPIISKYRWTKLSECRRVIGRFHAQTQSRIRLKLHKSDLFFGRHLCLCLSVRSSKYPSLTLSVHPPILRLWIRTLQA